MSPSTDQKVGTGFLIGFKVDCTVITPDSLDGSKKEKPHRNRMERWLNWCAIFSETTVVLKGDT